MLPMMSHLRTGSTLDHSFAVLVLLLQGSIDSCVDCADSLLLNH